MTTTLSLHEAVEISCYDGQVSNDHGGTLAVGLDDEGTPALAVHDKEARGFAVARLDDAALRELFVDTAQLFAVDSAAHCEVSTAEGSQVTVHRPGDGDNVVGVTVTTIAGGQVTVGLRLGGQAQMWHALGRLVDGRS